MHGMHAMTGRAGRVTFGVLALSGAMVLAQAPATPPAAPAPGGQPPQGAAAPRPGTVTGTLANDTARGASLMAEARKALGGDDKFKAVKTLEVRGKSARAQQQANLSGDFEIDIEMPGKFRRKETLGLQDISIDIVQLVNGDMATQNVEMGGGPQGGIGGFDDGGAGGGRGGRGRGGRGNDIARFLTGGSDDPEQQAKAVRAGMARMITALLLMPPDPIAWVGVAESPDGKADVLQFKTPDGVETRLLLDEKTHLPLMMQWTGTTQVFNRGNNGGGGRGGNFPQDQAPNQGRRGGANRGGASVQQASLQMHLSDYKSANGLKFPYLIQSGANEETTEELVVKTIRVNPTFKPEQFSK
jgi:hypothetical protein